MPGHKSSIGMFTLALALALTICALPAPLPAQQFISISYPAATGTYPNGINNRAEIVGSYMDSDGGSHGFTLINGQFASFDFPDAAGGTYASNINDLGEIVGAYALSQTGTVHGFLFDGVAYSTIDFPGSNYTVLYGINNLGEIVGNYTDAGSTVTHGFSLTKAGVFTTIDFPGSNLENYPSQINNLGVIVGGYSDSKSVNHGFIYKAGVFTAINFPGASSTGVTGVNDSGEVSGFYCDAATCPIFTPGPQRSFFTMANDRFTTIGVSAVPSETSNLNLALNNAGQLVAAYQDSAGGSHGDVSAIGPFALVPEFNSQNLLVYDVSAHLLVKTVSVGGGPIAAAASPDGSRIYVTSFGGGTLTVLDGASYAIIATVSVGALPGSIAVSPDGKRVYVGGGGSNTVYVIDSATNTVVSTIPVASSPGFVAITPNGKFAYVSNGGSNGIAVIDTSTNTITASVAVGGSPQGLSISPNGQSVYVACPGSGAIYVLSTASNSVSEIIPVPGFPYDITISPDGATGYVSEYYGDALAFLDLSSNAIVATVPVGGTAFASAVSPDGSQVWQSTLNSNAVSVISTASQGVETSLAVSGGVYILSIGNIAPTSQTLTQPLSPTAPNTFNFGPHNFTVQYPSGTSFSNVNMTVVAAQANQQTFKQRVAGTQFANATCIVYSGAGGNCVDYQVTCSSANGGTISCPSESSPTISVKTSFDTQQQIINPGFLTTPIGENDWTNIFESFYLQRIDPTVKGRTRGFSEFVAVDLGASNEQGAGNATLLAPLAASDDRIFPSGTTIPVQFSLVSIAHPGTSVTDATAGISVVQTADSKGNAVANIVLDAPTGFAYSGSSYKYSLKTSGYAAGTYVLTIYGNAFAAQQVQFTIPAATSGAHLVTTLQSLTLNSSTNQYVATISIANTGTSAANGVLLTAAKLNTTATSTALPLGVGDISAASSITATLTFPTSAGAAGSPGSLSISETYAGGSTGAGVRVLLP